MALCVCAQFQKSNGDLCEKGVRETVIISSKKKNTRNSNDVTENRISGLNANSLNANTPNCLE